MDAGVDGLDAGARDAGPPDTGPGAVDSGEDAGLLVMDAGPPPDWAAPTCTTVMGLPTATFSTDDGATLAPNLVTLMDRSYTDDLVLVEPPGTALAIYRGDVYRTTDSGCTWFGIGLLDGNNFYMTAMDGSVWAWGVALRSIDGAVAYRIDGTTITPLGIDDAIDEIIGMGVSAAAPGTLRLADGDCNLWESTDRGASWSRLRSGPMGRFGPPLAHQAAFDASDLDHAVCGVSTDGVWHTDDGGASWTQATGFPSGNDVNAFDVRFSPVDPTVVWAKTVDFDLLGGGPTFRRLFRSTDGGRSFTIAVDDGVVPFRNSVRLAPHPTDANVVYFPIEDSIHRYDASGTGTLTSAANGMEFVDVLTVLPTTPHVLLIGLERTGPIP